MDKDNPVKVQEQAEPPPDQPVWGKSSFLDTGIPQNNRYVRRELEKLGWTFVDGMMMPPPK